jgi:glycosyltransferase involved in cell wall biosynthesis
MARNRDVSIVLNVFRRSKHFPEQLRAIQNQSVAPKEILVWENGEEEIPQDLREFVTLTRASKNFGVWARFAHALNAESEFVCVIDDDTIPGRDWLKNCLDTMAVTPGLLGTRGLVFESSNNYSINQEFGVYGSNEQTVQVDIVGHSWFFRREWLAAYWAEYGCRFESPVAGEDIHFSFAIQKHLGIPTLVPPHRSSHPDEWGSDPRFAREIGEQAVAISKGAKAMEVFERALQHYRSLGFKTLVESNESQVLPISRFPKWVYWVASRFPGLSHRLGGFGLVQSLLRTLNKLK